MEGSGKSEQRPFIVVGVDGSELSRAALRWGAEYARQRGARIVAVHAWSYPAAFGLGGGYLLPDVDLAGDALLILRNVVDEELQPDVASQVELEAPFDAAGPALVKRAADAELIVLGASGGNPLTRWLIGSTTAHVVQHAHCPVLVFRPPAKVADRPTVLAGANAAATI